MKKMIIMMVAAIVASVTFANTIAECNYAALEINTNNLGIVTTQLKDTSKLTETQVQQLRLQQSELKKMIKQQKQQAQLLKTYNLEEYSFEDAANAAWLAYEHNKPLMISKWFSKDDEAYNLITSTGIQAQGDSGKKLALVLELIRER